MTEGLRPASATDCDFIATRQRLVGLAVRFVWNRDDAEEIVQEAFRLALQGGIATNDSHFIPWMNRTVTNLCLNQRRKRRMQSLPDDAAYSSSNAAETREQMEQLRDHMTRLPDQQRTALTLRAMQQMSYGEIAEIMELSEAAVRTHVHLARRTLIERSANEGSRRT